MFLYSGRLQVALAPPLTLALCTLFHTFYYFELNGKIIHELAFNHDFKVPIVA